MHELTPVFPHAPSPSQKTYKLILPNSGRRGQGAHFLREYTIKGADVKKGWEKVKPTGADMKKAEKMWKAIYGKTECMCIHEARGEKPGEYYDANGMLRERKGNRDCWLNKGHHKHNGSNFCPIGRRGT